MEVSRLSPSELKPAHAWDLASRPAAITEMKQIECDIMGQQANDREHEELGGRGIGE